MLPRFKSLNKFTKYRNHIINRLYKQDGPEICDLYFKLQYYNDSIAEAALARGHRTEGVDKEKKNYSYWENYLAKSNNIHLKSNN